MDLYEQMGQMALGSRLKRLADRMLDNASRIYELYDVTIDPRWFPVFFALSQTESLSTGEIARRIGHSHASVSQIVKEMCRQGFAEKSRDPADGRTNVIRLSATGREVIPKAHRQYRDVNAAVDDLLSEGQHNLLHAVAETERLLAQKSMFERVREKLREHVHAGVRIVDFEPQHATAYSQLNYRWIEQYFEIEAADRRALDHPEEYVLDRGGAILIALYEDAVVGCCALLNNGDGSYEMAKMAVAEEARGKHIGWLLGLAVVERARQLGGSSIYLESNTVLEPAIQLYRKLGFKQICGKPTPYARCNIQMEIRFEEEASATG